ncbi:MAG: Clp protease N-terminal domain-containing protein [Acidimicrobiales bacterium]
MFERFTVEARSTVLTAQEEARSLGHNYIGTEHLLLALVTVGGPPIGEVLAPYGLTHDAVRADILGIVGRGDGAGAGHIPFTPRSKKVLELSLREAFKVKHKTIEPAHILLGLIREGEGVAAQLLVKHGADLRQLRAEVLAELGGGGGKARPSRGRMVQVTAPPAPFMTRAGANAYEQFRSLAGGSALGSQHILLGLLSDTDSVAARALAALGVTREAVEAQLAQIDPAGTSDELPEQAAARRTSFELDRNVVTVRMEDPDLATKLGAALRDMDRPVVIPGTDVPAFDQFWRAVRPALEEISIGFSKQVMAHRLGDTEDVTLDRLQSTWAVAEYTVSSTPDGFRARLLPNHLFTNDEEVRAFLRKWFAENQPILPDPPGGDPGYVSLSIRLTRAGSIRAGAPEPEALAVGSVTYAPGESSGAPRVPLADLVTFALTDLAPDPEATG